MTIFIVPDPVTPTRFLTSLVPTTSAEAERLIRSAPAKTSPLDLLLQSEFGVTDNSTQLDSIIRVGQSSAPVTQVNCDVPQGSVLEDILIGRVINSYQLSQYADDTQLYTALVKSPENALQHVESFTVGLQHWFWENDLLLNPLQIGGLFLWYGT